MALKSNKTNFSYKPRTADQVKDRANRKSQRYDSIFKSGYDEFKARQGDNLTRYLPPTWDDADHYAYTIFVHLNIGPDNAQYLCLNKMQGKACPCCEASKEARDAGETEEARALGWSERLVSWMLDREGDDPEKPMLWSQSWTQDRDITALCINERTGSVLMVDHPDQGFDISFKRTGTGLKTKYYGWQVDRQESPIAENQKVQDSILDYISENPIPDVLNFYDYDYIKGVLSGTVPAKDRDLVDDAEENEVSPANERRTSARKGEAPFDEEEVDDETPSRPHGRAAQQVDPEDNEEESAPPARRSVARRPEPEEVEDEEKPAPRTVARRRVVEEVVEEEEEDVVTPPRRAGRR